MGLFRDKEGDLTLLSFFLIVGSLVCFITSVNMAAITLTDRKSQALHNAHKASCEKLNPKYGKYYSTKAGPYEGIVMVAIRFSDESVGLQLPNGLDEPLQFYCDDLVEVR